MLYKDWFHVVIFHEKRISTVTWKQQHAFPCNSVRLLTASHINIDLRPLNVNGLLQTRWVLNQERKSKELVWDLWRRFHCDRGNGPKRKWEQWVKPKPLVWSLTPNVWKSNCDNAIASPITLNNDGPEKQDKGWSQGVTAAKSPSSCCAFSSNFCFPSSSPAMNNRSFLTCRWNIPESLRWLVSSHTIFQHSFSTMHPLFFLVLNASIRVPHCHFKLWISSTFRKHFNLSWLWSYCTSWIIHVDSKFNGNLGNSWFILLQEKSDHKGQRALYLGTTNVFTDLCFNSYK